MKVYIVKERIVKISIILIINLINIKALTYYQRIKLEAQC